jgi:hypothetical protein
VGSSHGKLTKNPISGGFGPRFLVFVSLLVLLAPSVAAQDESVPRGWRPDNPFAEDEAPPAIFSLDAGDGDVDLYLLGSWAVSSRLATGIAFHPPLGTSGRRVTIPYEYPGFESRLFSQTVDLTISCGSTGATSLRRVSPTRAPPIRLPPGTTLLKTKYSGSSWSETFRSR